MMKFFHSDMVGAPVMSGTAGATIGILDACLKDGFGSRSVTSLVVSGGVATATVATDHPGVVNGTIVIAGSSISALNGDQVVTTATGNTVSWATTAADGTASGTITLKASPIGWTKPYSGTNLAAYRSANVAGTRCYLRVNDAGTTTSRVVGYETMTAISTGTNLFPTNTQYSGGMYWPKSDSADTTPRKWFLVGDDRMFYFYVSPYSAFQTHGVMFGFGDILSNKSGDAWNCAIFGGTSNVSATGSYEAGDIGQSIQFGNGSASQAYLARAQTALAGAVLCGKTSPYVSGQSGFVNQGYLTFPNAENNGLLLAPVDVFSGSSLRGRLPGVSHTPQYIADAIAAFATIDGAGAYAGRKMTALRTGPPASSSSYGPIFLDITGPWR